MAVTKLSSTSSMVVFSVDSQRYALPVSLVKRIIRSVEISQIPNGPEEILGMINVHGKLIPVFDIRRKLKLPKSELSTEDFIVLSAVKNKAQAFIVNDASFTEFHDVSIIPVEGLIEDVESVGGMIKDALGVIYILLETVLYQSDKETLKQLSSFYENNKPIQVPGVSSVEDVEVPERSVKDRTEILKNRAQLLSQEIYETISTTDTLEVLEFNVDGEKYGIETKFINKVCHLNDLTPLPGVPSFIIGIVNVRGHITPVIDIKIFFDLPKQALSVSNKIIVVNIDDAIFGVLSDDVVGRSIIPMDEIQSSLPTLTGIRSDYLKGVTDNQLVILDLHRLATDKNIEVNEIT